LLQKVIVLTANSTCVVSVVGTGGTEFVISSELFSDGTEAGVTRTLNKRHQFLLNLMNQFHISLMAIPVVSCRLQSEFFQLVLHLLAACLNLEVGFQESF
jgi:hypothetical protein